MKVVPASADGRKAPSRADHFTGDVRGEARLSDIPGVTMNTVLFAPGARTHWHSHEDGQIIHVVAGQGFVGTADGELSVVSEGDTVWSPPGEVHYHGATHDNFMVHDAISLGSINWMEEVPDDRYGRRSEGQTD